MLNIDYTYASGAVDKEGKVIECDCNVQEEKFEQLQDIPLVIDREIFIYPDIADKKGINYIAKAYLEEDIKNKRVVAIRLEVIDEVAFKEEGGEEKLKKDLQKDMAISSEYSMDDNIHITRINKSLAR